jgi:hypothetical protein
VLGCYSRKYTYVWVYSRRARSAARNRLLRAFDSPQMPSVLGLYLGSGLAHTARSCVRVVIKPLLAISPSL